MNCRFLLPIILFIFHLLGGCSLDVYPDYIYDEDDLWTEDEHFEAALIGCYNGLYHPYLFGGMATPLFFEALTPNAYNYNNAYGIGVIAEGGLTPSNSEMVNNRWKGAYELIGRCNTLLEHLNYYEMNAKRKETMRGEAYFLRALGYFILITHYGDVPLLLGKPSPEDQYSQRNEKGMITSHILNDLGFAERVLPKKYISTERGRVTWGAVVALKCRINLYQANWKKVIDESDKLVGSGLYELFPSYRDLFLANNEGNSEVIFDIQFDRSGQCHSFDLILQLYNSVAPLRGLVDLYRLDDVVEYDDYVNYDPRFYATIVYPGADFLGDVVEEEDFQMTGYAFKKYTKYDKEHQDAVLVAYHSDINYIYLRYADVLLMRAEALNESTVKPTQEVIDLLNMVRQRESIQLPSLSLEMFNSKESMRRQIRKERQLEFAGEGIYYFDMIRWRTATEQMNCPIYNHKRELIMNRYFREESGYLWPIPEEEIRYNPNLLPNNPGF